MKIVTSGPHFTRQISVLFSAILACCFFVSQASSQTLSVGLTQSQYVTDAAYQSQSNTYSTVFPSFRAESFYLNNFLKTKADVRAIIPLSSEDDFNFYFPEFYAQVGDLKSTETDSPRMVVTFGRRRHEWSRLDSDWGIGLWQPLFRWDYVRPQQMGLTGLFVETHRRNLNFMAFVSGLHLPDQQSNFKIVNGELVSANRWFRPPVSRLQINKGDRDIIYDVEKPEVSEVVFNPSVGFSVRTGDPTYGPWTSFSVADKPANQFHIAIQTEGINNLATGVIEPIIHPSLIRHRLATAETGFQGERASFYLSATAERFSDPKLPEKWEQTPLRDANYYGVGLSRDTHFFRTRALIYSGFVYRDETATTDDGLISAQLSSSTQKMGFERLWSIGARYPVYPQRHLKWSSEVKYTYSFSDRGEWLMGQLGYSPEVNWKLYVGFDIFGAPDEFDGVQSFISKYRDNDRIEGGFSHVF